MDALGSRIVPHELVSWAELDGESVLLHIETGIYFGLDAVGTLIWQEISRGATEDQILAAILAEYEVDPAVLRVDVLNFLNLLEHKGLVCCADGGE